MAWTTPMTAVAGAFNASDWNTYVRDNLACVAPGIAGTNASDWFVSTGANTLAPRSVKSAYVQTPVSTTSTTYTDGSPAGPSVTITTGTFAIVGIFCFMSNDTIGNAAIASYAISGATTKAANDNTRILVDGLNAAGSSTDNSMRFGAASAETLTAGSNTFTFKIRVAANTGWYQERRLIVWAF